MTSGTNLDFREELGFAPREEVEAYLVDGKTSQARKLGPLRIEYNTNEPRLYERFEFTMDDDPANKSVFFGQKGREPFKLELIKVEPSGRLEADEFQGELETEFMKAEAVFSCYSRYSRDRWILTLSIRKNRETPRTASALPEGWT